MTRADLPAGPQRDVRDLLHDLHEKAGRPAMEALERRIAEDDRLDGAPRKDLIHKIISRGGPARLDDVRAVARVLARDCHQDEHVVAAEVARLMDPFAQPPAPPADRRPRWGRPVGDCDPLALEVHPAIDVPGTRQNPLPRYVARAHDAQLRQVVKPMLADRSSRLITVVGGSSTGKTRACWELIRYLEQEQPGRWWLWHPYDPTRPDAVLANLDQVGPDTVVWLNEAQFYLQPPDARLGERVAAGLRTLLHDRQRGPVLVLATLWPQYWDELTLRPQPRMPDPYAQARDLLAGSRVSVPDRFTPGELAGLAHPGVDPRLKQAATHAEGARITQYLAGASELQGRYDTAVPAAKAILRVAMDARRLGYPPALPRILLEQAAPGYLDDHDWDTLADDWLEQALGHITRPGNGVRGPLTRIRARPGDPPAPGGQPYYRLADYLDQLGRHERGGVYPPESLWSTFAATVTDPDLLQHLGHQAQRRGRYQQAISLYTPAANQGNTDALRGLAEMRDLVGDAAGAEDLGVQAAVNGDTGVLEDLAWKRERVGDTVGAAALYRQAADHGSTDALEDLACMRDQAAESEDPLMLAVRRLTSYLEQVAADSFDQNVTALWKRAEMREKAGDAVGAEALYRQAIDQGSLTALGHLARMREKSGDLLGADRLRRFGLTGAGDVATGLEFGS